MRTETDFLGKVSIPDDALYGIHAFRAQENFPDTTPFHPEWYKALGLVKKACFLTAEAYAKAVGEKLRQEKNPQHPSINPALQRHPSEGFTWLIHAAGEVAEGDHYNHFIVPAISGGAGTSINMNINEIITNVALMNMGEKAGRYDLLDPVDHANVYQSTNDVIPTSLRVATMFLLLELEKAINDLRFVVEQVETSNHHHLRIGYTQMQEAVPTSFGKLFSTYSEALSRDWWRVSKCFERIKTINLGGSAIGTGLTVPRYFIMEATTQLQKLTGLPLARSENLADATSNLDSFVEVHAILKAHAVNLEKMVADIRLLASDLTTRTVAIPARQVGSSIMPGKVNPVIPEFVISAAHTVYANDQLIASLAAQGCLELNAYLPVIGHALIGSIKLLKGCNETLRAHLFTGLEISAAAGLETLYRSPAITTALVTKFGYARAADVAKLMKERRIDIFEANTEIGLASHEELLALLRPDNLLKLGFTLTDLEIN